MTGTIFPDQNEMRTTVTVRTSGDTKVTKENKLTAVAVSGALSADGKQKTILKGS